jgi:hypothetical protein
MSKAAIMGMVLLALITGICPLLAGSPQMQIQAFHPLAPSKPAKQTLHPPAARMTLPRMAKQGTKPPKPIKGRVAKGKASAGKRGGR